MTKNVALTEVSYGSNCKDSTSTLTLLRLGDLTKYIRQDQELQERTRLLRSVLRYGTDRYKVLKTKQPFFCCSIFDPPQRSVQNFSAAMGLILDIDFPAALDLDVYNMLLLDPATALLYISPSGHGIKVMYCFDKPITDAALYTRLYRSFSHQKAHELGIVNVVDYQNCDVSRISFVVHDPEVYLNHDPLMIETDEYCLAESSTVLPTNTAESPSIAPDVYKQILHTLGSRPHKKATQSTALVAEHLLALLPHIREKLSSYSIVVTGVYPLQSGAKLGLQLQQDLGEINVYHGKRGYSIVASPKKGTNAQLNEAAKHILLSVAPFNF